MNQDQYALHNSPFIRRIEGLGFDFGPEAPASFGISPARLNFDLNNPLLAGINIKLILL